MKVEVKEVESLVHELSVEIEPERVNEMMDAKFNEARREVTLKGFRKGHAPMNMIKAKFADEIRADVADELVKSTYPAAIKEKELKVATHPTITDLNFTDGGGLAYTARVEVMPKIEALSFEGMEVSKLPTEVTDEDVTRAVEQIRKAYAEQRTVTRPIEGSDIVVADLRKTYDSKGAIPNEEYPDAVIELANPVTVKEFREQLPGMRTGDEKEVEVVYDSDYPDEAFAGATIRYHVKIKEVREELLPTFDDHLAKQTGQAETVLELKLKIREDLKAQKEQELRRFNRNELVRQMVEANKIPVPNGLVNEYLDAMVEDVKQRDAEADEAEVRSAYHGVAVTTLRWNLLYNHIARQENLQVTREDTDKVIKRFAENYRITEQQAAEALQRSGKVESVRDTLIEEKVLDFLMTKAKVVNKEPEPAAKNG